MESKEERLLNAIFNNTEDEPDDNYPETVTEKVGYSEYVIIHALQNIAQAIQRLSRLHRLLMVSEKDGENKLPDIITNNELRMALSPLLQVENDAKDIAEMLTEKVILKSTGCRYLNRRKTSRRHTMIDLTAIDDSIGYMTEMRSLCSVPDGNVAKAYDTALACLRECAERREGCEYCTSRFDIASHHTNAAGLQAGTNKKATHCPMCGRKLERSDT